MKKKDLEQFMELSQRLEEVSNVDVEIIESVTDELETKGLEIMSQVVNEDETEEIKQAMNEMNLKAKAMRGIGQRFFNLFKVTLTVSFAGVTLIHFTIPKQR